MRFPFLASFVAAGVALGFATGLGGCLGTASKSDGGGGGSADMATRGDASATIVDGSVDSATSPVGDAASPLSRVVYVAGGQDVRRVVTFDGKTIASDTYVTPTGADNAFGAIAMGNGIIVGVADSGIYVSNDGMTWTIVAKPDSVSSLHSAAGTFGGGKFVFVSADAAYTSTDGMTWAVTTNSAQSAGHWHGMAYGNGHFVAIGDNVRKVSEDGATWHDFDATTLNLAAIGFGNGIFVVTAQDTTNTNASGYSATSTDGVTWTTATNTATSYSSGFAGVAYGAGHWVTGDCCNAFTSSDGKTWTKQGAGFAQGALGYSGTEFVGIGWRTNFFSSTDGTAFTKIFSDDGLNKYNPDMEAPWLTTVGAGFIH